MITSDTDLIQHLLALYFCWEYPTFASLSKEHHLRDFHDGRSRYCPLLGCRSFDQHAVGEILAIVSDGRFFRVSKTMPFRGRSLFNDHSPDIENNIHLGSELQSNLYERVLFRLMYEVGYRDGPSSGQ